MYLKVPKAQGKSIFCSWLLFLMFLNQQNHCWRVSYLCWPKPSFDSLLCYLHALRSRVTSQLAVSLHVRADLFLLFKKCFMCPCSFSYKLSIEWSAFKKRKNSIDQLIKVGIDQEQVTYSSICLYNRPESPPCNWHFQPMHRGICCVFTQAESAEGIYKLENRSCFETVE